LIRQGLQPADLVWPKRPWAVGRGQLLKRDRLRLHPDRLLLEPAIYRGSG